MVEFAFVGVLLVFFVLGITHFGLLLSFKQDMTRAAAEGARAGAVAVTEQDAYDNSVNATEEAVRGFVDVDPPLTEACNTGTGMKCFVNLHDCATPIGEQVESGNSVTGDCVTVELVYDYKNHPLLPDIPLIAAMLPDTISDRSVARVN